MSEREENILKNIKDFYADKPKDNFNNQKNVADILDELAKEPADNKALSVGFLEETIGLFWIFVNAQYSNITNKYIAIFFMALGKLSKKKRLPKLNQYASGDLENILNYFFERNSSIVKDITLTLNGLSSLVRDGIIKPLENFKVPENIWNLIHRVGTPKDKAIFLHSLGTLSKYNWLRQNALSFSETESMLDSLCCKTITGSQEISSSLYGISLMAEAQVLSAGKFSEDVILSTKDVLLSYKKSHNPKDIANYLYGLSLLAKNRMLKDSIKLDIREIRDLLRDLLSSDLCDESSVIILYALGILGKENKLEGRINGSFIDECLKKLCDNNLVTLDIANALIGVAYLAKGRAFLSGSISEKYIKELLQKLFYKIGQAENQHITITLYAIGILADESFIHPEEKLFILMSGFLHYPEKLFSSQTTHISNAIYGLGVFANKLDINKEISLTISASFSEKMLGFLTRLKADPQHIANTLYGLGFLAPRLRHEGESRGMDAEIILNCQLILKNLMTNNATPQEISMSLYSLGKIARTMRDYSLTQDKLSLNSVNYIFNGLLDKVQTKTHDISRSLHGLEVLTKRGVFKTKDLDFSFIEKCIKKITQQYDIQSFSSSLASLGSISDSNVFSSSAANSTIIVDQNFLKCLYSCVDNSESIACALYGLGQLIEKKLLRIEAAVSASKINRLLEALITKNPTSRKSSKSLVGIALLVSKIKLDENEERLSSNMIVENFKCALSYCSSDFFVIAVDAINRLLPRGNVLDYDIIKICLKMLLKHDSCDIFSVSFLRLAYLAKNASSRAEEYFDEELTKEVFQAVDRYCSSSDSESKISNLLLGVGLFIERGIFKSAILEFTSLFHAINIIVNSPSLSAINTHLRALNLLAQHGILSGTILSSEWINSILQNLLNSLSCAEKIADCLYFLGKLTRMGIASPAEPLLINRVLEKIQSTYWHDDEGQFLHQASIGIAYLGREVTLDIVSQIRQIHAVNIQTPNVLKQKLLKLYPDMVITIEDLAEVFFVDVLVLYRGKRYVIELDGLHHYAYDGKLRAKDRMRDEYLTEKGYAIFRYPVSTPSEEIIQDFTARLQSSYLSGKRGFFVSGSSEMVEFSSLPMAFRSSKRRR